MNEYVFREVASSGIEMVKVETVLQAEEYALFEVAFARAKVFLEEQCGVSDIDLAGGREIGASAPERIHQITPLPADIRVVDHTWLLVLSGSKEYTARTLFFLLEVMYHFQDQEWQFAIRVLREGDDYETSSA